MTIIRTSIYRLFSLIELLILARIIMSYIPSLRTSRIYAVIFQLTEPILYPVRELLFKIGINKGMIDFSPIAAYILLGIVRSLILSIL
jgi:YggT family protein